MSLGLEDDVLETGIGMWQQLVPSSNHFRVPKTVGPSKMRMAEFPIWVPATYKNSDRSVERKCREC